MIDSTEHPGEPDTLPALNWTECEQCLGRICGRAYVEGKSKEGAKFRKMTVAADRRDNQYVQYFQSLPLDLQSWIREGLRVRLNYYQTKRNKELSVAAVPDDTVVEFTEKNNLRAQGDVYRNETNVKLVANENLTEDPTIGTDQLDWIPENVTAAIVDLQFIKDDSHCSTRVINVLSLVPHIKQHSHPELSVLILPETPMKFEYAHNYLKNLVEKEEGCNFHEIILWTPLTVMLR